LGDSITKGVRNGVAENETFSHVLGEKLRQADWQVEVENQGVGGETTAGGLARLDRDVLAKQPDIVAIMYGTNDCYIDPGKQESRLSLEEYENNLVKLIQRVRAVGAEPIVMTEPRYADQSPTNGLGEHGNVRLERYVEACRRVALRQDAVLIDHFGNWTSSREGGQRLETWTTDGYHPNPAGHAQIARTMLGPIETALRSRQEGPVTFRVRLDEVLSHDDGKSLWYHARGVAFPRLGTLLPTLDTLLTLQRHLMADDHYDGLAVAVPDRGGVWKGPYPVPALAWKKDDAGRTIAVCDVTPGYHAATQRVIAIGAKILYDDQGKHLTDTPFSHQVAYASLSVHPRGAWSEWKTLELPPDESRFFLATAGCAQWLVDDADGSMLLPIYHKGPSGEAYSVTVLRCGFDGERMTLLELGKTLELNEVRGLCEPSLARFRGKYYLTLRNDLRGYVTTSEDGLVYGPIEPWQFDDGAELGSYNTQQHWLVHSEGLFLAYTRRGADNDHIIRHRAPLFLAQVDPAGLRVLRRTEQVVMPERGGEYGNFGANAVSIDESWLTAGEGVWNDDARKRGAKGTVYIAHIEWSLPNRLRGGSGPGTFVDQLQRTRD
jgi:lysophospholipase L1-like esterase